MSGITVVKIGGGAIDRADGLGSTWSAIARLHETLASDGGGVVLVHGGGAAVDRRFAELGLEAVKREGIRVTPEGQVSVVVGVLSGEVNARLCGLLDAAGARAVGMTLSSGGLICERNTGYSFDAGRVGVVRGVRDDLLSSLISSGLLPVLACVGVGVDGGLLNINGDDAASGVASAVGADRLVLMTDVPGVKDAGGEVIGDLDAEGSEALIASGVIAGGMVPKVRGALSASARSGSAVVIAAFDDPGVFEKLGRGEVVGTTVRAVSGVRKAVR